MGYFIQVSVLALYRDKRQELKQRHLFNILYSQPFIIYELYLTKIFIYISRKFITKPSYYIQEGFFYLHDV